MRRTLATVGGALIVTLASAAYADDPPPAKGASDAPPPSSAEVEDATRAAARRIAEEGLNLYDTARYAEALERFEKASALVRAPTMGLMAARSLEKLGRWVEASEKYLAVMRMQLEADASTAFKEAQVSAASERGALMPRIPTLVLTIRGGDEGATVTLDGKPIAAALLGIAFPADPGPHTVVLTRGKLSKTERLILKEKEARSLTLSADAPPPIVTPPPAGSSGLRIAGWVSLALGGAGVALGAVTGAMVLSSKADLDKQCPEYTCPNGVGPSTLPDGAAQFNSLIYVPVPSLIGGALAAAAGGLMLGLSPSAQPSKAAVKSWVGPGGGAVRIDF